MVMDRDDIFSKIQEVLDDALGVDEDEVTPEASLTADLGAESIDFLDIVFRIEKTFDVKISQGELFPENLVDNEEWVSDGKLTDAGLVMLKGRMAHVEFDSFEGGDRSISKLGDAITVNSLVNFVELKLAS
jgi:acyl carrier protein